MYTVMMVCTGNICRSPMAEVVLRAKLEDAGISDLVSVDSTGVSDEEEGNPIDTRARRVLESSGYSDPVLYAHSARQVTRSMLESRDLVLVMTQRHAQELLRIQGAPTDGVPLNRLSKHGDKGSEDRKIRMFRSFDAAVSEPNGLPDEGSDLDLADPWYGGMSDFVECLEQVEAAMDGLVEHIRISLARI